GLGRFARDPEGGNIVIGFGARWNFNEPNLALAPIAGRFDPHGRAALIVRTGVLVGFKIAIALVEPESAHIGIPEKGVAKLRGVVQLAPLRQARLGLDDETAAIMDLRA